MTPRPLLLSLLSLSACAQLAGPPLDLSFHGSGLGFVDSVTPRGQHCEYDCRIVGTLGGVTELTQGVGQHGTTFVGWAGACTGVEPCRFTANGGGVPTQVMAAFAVKNELVVAKPGDGTGTVRSTPEGIDCGADCTELFPLDATVTLVATPEPGTRFVGWSGACTGTAPCVVTTAEAKLVAATFEQVRYRLSVSRGGPGEGLVQSDDGNVSCGAACEVDYLEGTTVRLTASGISGGAFAGWQGACSGTGPCTVVMTKDLQVSATFTGPPGGGRVTISVSRHGAAGSVVSSPPGINCGSTCSASFYVGNVVTLTPVPEPGTRFEAWQGGGGVCTGQGPCTFTVTGQFGVTAYFVLSP